MYVFRACGAERPLRGGGERPRHRSPPLEHQGVHELTMPAQKERDRQAALEAAASLQRAASADEVSEGELDHRSHSIDSDSHHSDAAPQVTSRMADDLC
ncbi:hypothetical protein NDU88_007299 [Pleurodeles waltl]|uniref:Uncharacterized protein n=1 Tax=Pleurodeles waltl TaxID=8319 RepID=A0AAV7N3P0_PLEWA|nr:hypothetical protein NDU88_007299 [Pleurodeles waltl]